MSEGTRVVEIELARDDPRWGESLAILQSGFSMSARGGMSARDFMREVLGLPDDYIEGVVSTLFLDDKPVDDIDRAFLSEGSRVALSAAMPGLLGAMMRRDSPYASLRATITHATDVTAETRALPILVGVKLFNSVMRDRGREIFRRGVILEAAQASKALLAAGIEIPAAMDAERPDGQITLRIREAET